MTPMLVLLVVLAVIIPALPMAAAMDCRGATPLPDDVTLVAPPSDVAMSAPFSP
jgi:hypothetical protein